jgi:predicted SAM-dependent methyltransferase
MSNPSEQANPLLELKRVLHVGCGMHSEEKLHPVFRGPNWLEIRVDIDPAVKPDIQASITDLREHVRDGTIDAIWSSHNIEHVYDHEVSGALREFVRVLRPEGFALITCPDLEAIANLVSAGVDRIVYESPAGPITPLDMLFGHRRSIQRGNLFMCHRTGFTEERLGRLVVEAGFVEARLLKGKNYELWSLGLMTGANRKKIDTMLAANGLAFGLCNLSESIDETTTPRASRSEMLNAK